MSTENINILRNYKLAIITCDRKSILVLPLVFMQFVMFAIGKTKAALPINTNANNVELRAIEVPALLRKHGNVLKGNN